MSTTSIDHGVIAVRDLDAARAEVAALGFQVTPGAKHERFGTANNLCVFRKTYLELITVRDPDPPDRSSIDVLGPCIERGGGIPMLALATEDAAATQRRLVDRGVAAAEPVTWSRAADTPDGPRTASFTTLFMQSELLPELVTFFCQHHTPQFVRCPSWQRHANGARDLLGLEIHTPRPLREVAAVLRARLGPEEVFESDDSIVAGRAAAPVIYRYRPNGHTRRLLVAVSSLAQVAAIVGARAQESTADWLRVKLGCARDTEIQFMQEKPTP